VAARLVALSGLDCRVVTYRQVSPRLVAEVGPRAIVLSGATADWAEYDRDALKGLLALILDPPVSLLGICAGHQLIGFAHGASWGPVRELAVGPGAPGEGRQAGEWGYLTVRLDIRCPIFGGLPEEARFFQAHYWQLLEVPAGFALRASSPTSPIQAIERTDGRVFGVQFHPEAYDSRHPQGAVVLRNFFQQSLSHGRPVR